VPPDRIVRIVAWVYAVLSALGGALILAFVAVLIAAFGWNGLFEPKFFAFIVLPGILGIALAPFIWLRKAWAMVAVLAISVGLSFLFSRETLLLRVALPGVSVLFAAFTGVRFWLGLPTAPERD
jgi:hypothetical protein